MKIGWATTESAVDPCCCCPDCPDIETDLDVLITDYTFCGCFPTNPIDPLTTYLKRTAFTGIVGSYTAIWDVGLMAWYAVIGTATLSEYSSFNSTCEGDPINVFTGDVELIIGCSCARFSVSINAPGYQEFAGEGEADDVISNTIVCDPAPGPPPAIVGTVTVTLPP